MAFDFERIDQFSEMMDQRFFHPFYDHLHEMSQRNRYVAYAAPLVGSIDGIGSLIQATGTVGEALIKSLGNGFKGAISCDWIAFKTGSLQLLLGAGVIGLCSIPIIVFRILRITTYFALDPQKTSEQELAKLREKILKEAIPELP